MRELGISATTPTDFIERAKGIVCSHNDLQKKRGGLESEIRRLELDQEQLIARKEKEILDSVLASKAGLNQEVNLAELRARVKSDIEACLEDSRREETGSPLPRVGSDITLTKVPAEKLVKKVEEVEVLVTNGEEAARRRLEEEGRKKEEQRRKRQEEEMRWRGEEGRRRAEEETRRVEEEGRRSNSEHSSPGTQGVRKATAAPRAQDDYEDR